MISQVAASAALLMRRRKIGYLYGGMDIYHPLASVLTSLPTGQAVTIEGTNYAPTTYMGIDCMRFDAIGDAATTQFAIPYSVRPNYRIRWNGTVSIWLARTGFTTTYRTFRTLRLGPGTFKSTSGAVSIIKKNTSGNPLVAGLSYSANHPTEIVVPSGDTNWHHVAIVADTHTTTNGNPSQWDCDVYTDGQYVGHMSQKQTNEVFTHVRIGLYTNNTETGSIYAAALRVWHRPLSSEEIAELAMEFTPST